MPCRNCQQDGHNIRTCKQTPAPVSAAQPPTTPSLSKNAQTAKSGNAAEDILCKSTIALDGLGTQYFGKKIVKCERVPGRKKSDVIITFEDGTQRTIQVKNGTGGGRGWSFDRRSVDNMPTDEQIKELLKVVCLKSGGERKAVANRKELLRKLILGDDDASIPQDIIHTNAKNGVIESLSVCSMDAFLEAICKEAYEECNAKRTCVHLTPRVYLQRKGGGKADHSPNQIQAKLRSMPPIMKNITLG
jgi:hypothetical protein